MAEFNVRITGKNINVTKNKRDVVTVKGDIHRIYFMRPGEDSQLTCEFNRGKDIWISFRGRLLYVENSNKNEVMIRGDIYSYEGDMWRDDDITSFVVTPDGTILRSYYPSVDVHRLYGV